MNVDWKFREASNTACFTTTFVLDGSPILRVYHDYDGDWQFHGAPDQQATPSVTKLVCLADMINLDSSLNELHDLPYGLRATRTTSSEIWRRFKDNPFPSFLENGYYLEDAIWLSQYLSDINPPDAEIRKNLPVGAFVKLVFRFASEESERANNQCERMWVQVTGYDEDENYIGTIANDPHHASAKYGDALSFHQLHVADFSNDE
jgi:hypothetical protein